MTKTFDRQCFDLAAAFCPDGTPDKKICELAAGIQDYIDDWLSHEERAAEFKRVTGSWRDK